MLAARCKIDLTVQPGVYLAGNPTRKPRHGFELLERGFEEGFRGTEVFEYPLFARWADAGQLVEDGGGHGLAPQLTVVGVGEAVCLIADALEQV